ncbi:MAG TPA: TspO/MBR family protein [archaeon]|nr:TspO/MBR family protein [archaeon]
MNPLKLIVSILLCEAAGIIGSVFTIPAISGWYAGLQKPFFVPPNWVFAPAWTILFLLMGLSLYLVWEKGFKEKKAKIAIVFFIIQLALNVLWSALFFGLKSPFLAFVGIIFLWVYIAITIFEFRRISKKAALLLLPYIAWVSFAALLNYFVWILNA